MPLTETKIRALKPRDAAYKVTDEKGLYLLVTPAGGRLWKLKFRAPGGPEKKLSIGSYPDLSLKEARERRDDARKQLANGVDPAAQKRRDDWAAKVSASNTFNAVAEAYIAKCERDGLAQSTLVKRRWFTRLVHKSLGNRPISEIQPFEILQAVRPFEAARNDEKAHRTLQFIGSVFRYGVANQLVASDPTRDLRGALAKRKPKHLAAILEPKRVGELLRAIEGYEGQGLSITRIALRLSPLVFVRPGELRRAEWSEIDFEAAVWRIPAAKMKARIPHFVPLSRQAIELFKQAQALTGDWAYVWIGVQKGPRYGGDRRLKGTPISMV